MNKVKRLLVGMLIMGAVTAATATGTFATFNATTSNNAAVTTGVLVMSNTVAGGTGACYSTVPVAGTATIGPGNSNTCTDTLTLASLLVPGNATPVTDLTITNVGNVPASALQAQAGGLCSAASAGYTNGGITFTGSGTAALCGDIEVAIFKTNSAFSNNNASGVCMYGDPTQTDIAGAVSGTKCGFSATYNLSDFGANYKSGDSGAGGATGTKGPISAGSLTANGGATPSAYFLIGFKLVSTADNSVQGLKATENVTWFMVQ